MKSSASGNGRWEEIRMRLEQTTRQMASGQVLSATEAKRILKARAVALAVPEKAPADGQDLDLVEFDLAHETYLIEAGFIREITPLTRLTPLPGTPPFVLGIANVRNDILAVFDLKRFFNLPEKGLTDLDRLIVLSSEGRCFGILADRIGSVQHVRMSAIHPPPAVGTELRRELLKGVTSDGKIVLDGRRLMHDGRLVIREHVEGDSSRLTLDEKEKSHDDR